MRIKYNGHASFTITSKEGVVIVTDPYEPGAFGGGIKYGPIQDKVDIALVSHDHADHNYVKGLKGSPVIVKSSKEVKGVRFEAISVYHDPKQGAERGNNNLYVFSVDGIKLAFLGDLGHTLDDEQAKKLSDLDILLIPVGGFFTIDAGQAAKIVEKLKPKVVIPMHYKTEKCGFPIAGVDEFIKRMSKVKNTGKSELEVELSSLPEKGPEVWVMDYAC